MKTFDYAEISKTHSGFYAGRSGSVSATNYASAYKLISAKLASKVVARTPEHTITLADGSRLDVIRVG